MTRIQNTVAVASMAASLLASVTPASGASLQEAAPAAARAEHNSGAGQNITKTLIAENIYQFTTIRDSYVRQLNSVAIVNENDVLVFDTNTRPSSARIILAEIPTQEMALIGGSVWGSNPPAAPLGASTLVLKTRRAAGPLALPGAF